MAKHSPDQRNDYYLIEAARTGIHKPILAALYVAHGKPPLAEGETGLGIAPANRIPLSQVKTFPEQVKYAANTVRSLTNSLIADGWQGQDLWDTERGCYRDRFLRRLAEGYGPPATDLAAARLEPCDEETLIAAYIADLEIDYQAYQLPADLSGLDKSLLAFVARVPLNYSRLAFQRQALLEAVRLWRKLETHQEVALALQTSAPQDSIDEATLDKALIDFVQQVELHFLGYPNQREALIRLVQLWRRLTSREAVIQWLSTETEDGEPSLAVVDPAVVMFVQRLPTQYRGRGDQRLALTEGFRQWHGLESRTAAIEALGFDPQSLISHTADSEAMAQAATLIDRALLDFWSQVPAHYEGTAHQREALIQLIMQWRHIEGQVATVQTLLEDVRRTERANRDSIEAMPPPQPLLLPARPARWTPETLHLWTAIVANGHFTWAEATQGGIHMPTHQATIDAIVRIAYLAQEARDRIGRPFSIIRWYAPQAHRRSLQGSRERYAIGDALSFYCQGLTGQQLYWALDSWWPGGLSHHAEYPCICYLDARDYPARWTTHTQT